MSRRVESGREMVGNVETIDNDGKRTRHMSSDDCVATHHLDIELREYGFPPIFAGFQMEWGTVDVDGSELVLCSGAGLGSAWATVSYKGRHFAINAAQLVEEMLAKIDPTVESESAVSAK